jgi:hypothetical protein
VWEKLKAGWKYIAAIVALVAAFVVGLATAIKFPRNDPGGKSGLGTDTKNVVGAAEGLGKLEANQQSASGQNKSIADDNRSASAIIDSTKAKLDELDRIIGKYKDR